MPRQVRVEQRFFDRLDELLDEERGADGTPSRADFLFRELPAVIDALAEDFEGVTTFFDQEASVIRVLITAGVLVEMMSIYAYLDDKTVVVVWLDF